ncbi:Ubiquinone menaquinone biosynthesis C-methyltransferase protein [Rutstroemia sp. NJR-2017a BBW]|nr:Ubiquinone menaquinone biosynthesis C-methyltransferase protein [Rutstroemia sp. NJR-2017a BBW]
MQLIETALGDCTGLEVLDLGGGTGLHARQAIDLGATSVDIVDISPGMLKIAQDIENSLGRKDVIRFFEADVSKPLLDLPLREDGYDLVMGNWIFDCAETMEVLEGMFQNIVKYLKPGGRFIGIRHADPWSPAFENNRYGVSCPWIKEIPGGVKYYCVLHCTPPIEFEAASLEVIYSGSTEMYEKFGLTDITTVPYESAEVIQKDPEFWKVFLERPHLAVVQAMKK